MVSIGHSGSTYLPTRLETHSHSPLFSALKLPRTRDLSPKTLPKQSSSLASTHSVIPSVYLNEEGLGWGFSARGGQCCHLGDIW